MFSNRAFLLLTLLAILLVGAWGLVAARSRARGTNSPETMTESEQPGPGHLQNAATIRSPAQIHQPDSTWPVRVPLYFDSNRLSSDKNYRLIIREHLIQRNLRSLAHGNTNLAVLSSLLISNGVPEAVSSDLIRSAYEDVAIVRMFQTFATDEGRRKIAADKEIQSQTVPENIRTQLFLQNETIYGVLSNQWTFYAQKYREWAVERSKRDTGIQSDEFYDQLFAIPFNEGSTGISTYMAPNEPLFRD